MLLFGWVVKLNLTNVYKGSELSARPLKVPKRRLKGTKFYVKGDYRGTKSGAKGDFVQKECKNHLLTWKLIVLLNKLERNI